MHEFGTTSEQLAELAVAARQWSLLQPDAPYRRAAHRGRGAVVPDALHPAAQARLLPGHRRRRRVVLTSAERARDLTAQPVYLLGTGEAINHRNVTADARPDEHGGGRQLAGGRSRWPGAAGRHGHRAPLRRLHHQPAGAAGGPRVLRQGRGRRLRRAGAPSPPAARSRSTPTAAGSQLHATRGCWACSCVIEAVAAAARHGRHRRQVAGRPASLVHGMGMTLAAHATAVLSRDPEA